MDKHNIETVFNKYLHPIDEGILMKLAERFEVDKYVKKLGIVPFVKLFIYAQLKQISSLTDIVNILRNAQVPKYKYSCIFSGNT